MLSECMMLAFDVCKFRITSFCQCYSTASSFAHD